MIDELKESVKAVVAWAQYVWSFKITSHKVSALVYIDDRGWRFDGIFPSIETIRRLRQWNAPGAGST